MKNSNTPERKCVSCQEHKEKRLLIRVVKSPDGTMFVDESGKANGRGAYICRRMECLEDAQKRRRLEGALKAKLPSELFTQLKRIISDKGDAQWQSQEKNTD